MNALQKALTERELWKTAKTLGEKSNSRKAAIAYITKDHIGFRDGDVLAVDASDKAIAAGQTSAKLLRKLSKNGVLIYRVQGLHSKTILLDDQCIVGSANMSDSGLIELAVLTAHRGTCSGVATFIERLCNEDNFLQPPEIDRLCKIPVLRTGANRGKRPKSKAASKTLGFTTWIVGTYILARDPTSDEQREIDKDNEAINRRYHTRHDDHEWIRWGRMTKFAKECREGDTVIQISGHKGSSRRTVTRGTPLLLKRRHRKDFIRTYLADRPRLTDTVSWGTFQKILKAAGLKKRIGRYAQLRLSEADADAIDSAWNTTAKAAKRL